MSRPSTTYIVETTEELKQLMQAQKKPKIKERLQALYLLKSGCATTLQEVANCLGRSKTTIENWLTLYRKSGVLGVVAWNYRGGRPPAISEPLLAALREQLNKPQGFKSYGEIQQWLHEQYGVEIPYKTVHQTVHYKLKAKLKVARPTHIKRDDTAVVGFKKNSRLNSN